MIEFIELPYSENALEPFISAKTISFHYGKHHKTYLDNLNKLIVNTKFEGKDLEYIVLNSSGSIFNNAAQVWNHTFYWDCLTPNKTKPEGLLKDAIDKNFQSYENFVNEFTASCLSLFGSGWVWLVKDKNDKLSIIQESNAGNPMLHGLYPILCCDVWEHAYYIDKQNRRGDYVKEFFEYINWDFVAQNFRK